MAVTQLPDGRWHVDVTVSSGPAGRSRRRATCATRAEAVAVERRLLARRAAHGRAPLPDMRLAEFVEAVFAPEKSRRLREGTMRGYDRDLRLYVLPALGWMPLGEVSHMDVQRMLDGCPTGKAARNARATLSTVLGMARDIGLVDANVASGRYSYPADGPRAHGGGEVLQTFAECRALLDMVRSDSAGGQLDRLLTLGLLCGLRPGEARGLDWERVDLDRAELQVVQTYVEPVRGPGVLCPPKTERSRRTVPLPAAAVDAMASWTRSGAACDLFGADAVPVAANRRGGRVTPRGATMALARWVAAHPDAPRVTFESCRHSYATSCISAGVEVSVLSRMLGHRDVSTTYNRYIRPGLQAMRAAASTVDDAFNS